MPFQQHGSVFTPLDNPYTQSLDVRWRGQSTSVELMAPGLIDKCIEQIDEAPGGKQSCFLTSQLNAWIVRGELTPDEALHIQEETLVRSAFSKYWVDQSPHGRNYVAWSPRAADAAYAVRAVIGREVPQRITTANRLTKALDAGFAVVATSVEHSRLAYKVGHQRMAVFDAKFPQVRGVFGPEKLTKLQHPAQPVVVI